MMHRMRWIPLAAAIAAAALGIFEAGAASAQVRVAVGAFEGSGAAGARRQVQRALQDDSRVAPVDLDRVDSAAQTSPGASGIARELEARMIIQGEVSGRGRRRRLRLIALDESGREVASASGQMRGQGVERAVRSLLDDGLSRLPAPRQEVAEAPPPVRVPRDEEIEGPGDRDLEEADVGEEGPGGWETRAPLLEVQVGVVPRSREVDVGFSDGDHARYSVWYPELAARAELRPFNADTGILQGIYARGFFGHSILLSSRVDRTGAEVESTFWRADFGVGWLFRLVEVLDLGLEFGAGWDTYTFSENELLESAEYVYLRPAVRARMRLFQEYLVMGAEVGVRPVLSRGDFAQYGAEGDTVGFDVGGSIGGGFALADTFGITWAINVAYVNYWLNFSGGEDPAFTGVSGTDGGVRIGIFAGIGLW